ncbi:MAG: AMP-binding protein [Myxococcales bacterium]|nr:AMP-binding protein [Myxococcales bacterium]
MILDVARRDPAGLALTDGERSYSWAELADRVTRLTHLYRGELGLRPGDHAALLMENRTEAIELVLAAFFAGIWLTPVSKHLTEEEIAYVLTDSGARVILTDPAHEAAVRAAAQGEVVRVGDELEGMIAAASDAPLDLSAPAGATMLYTSGTTGHPKGVKRRRPADVAAALAGQEQYGHAIHLDGRGPHVVTGPLYHAAPLLFAVYDMQNGAPVVVMPRWDEQGFLDLVTEHGAPHTHLVPTMFVRLLRLPEAVRTAFDPSVLDVVLHGAAPIARDTKQQMIDWWGPVLVEYWGGSESGVATLATSEEWLAHPGTVGRAVSHYEVFAVSDSGARLPAGETGALYSRHRQVDHLFEYHMAAEKTAAAYLDESAFTLGDIGSVDSDGWVFLADRKSNMIITGGVNVYPAEVEQVLAAHPAVSDVGVFGIPDDEWGETVKAAIELLPGSVASPELEREILAFAREKLAGFKVPRSIDFEKELPRTPAGKLYVRRLRDRYWAGRDKNI